MQFLNFFNPKFDDYIKKFISKYKSEPTLVNYKILLNVVSDYIYNYPRLRFKLTLDECSDFYLYFIKRFPKLIQKYSIQKHFFVNWFNTVLRTNLINWIKKTNIKSNIEFSTVDINDFFDSKIENNLDPKKKNEAYFISKDGSKTTYLNKKEIQKILENLPIKLQCIIKLFFAELLSSKDFFKISTAFNIPIDKVLVGYKLLKKSHLKKIMKNKYYMTKPISSIQS